MRKVCIFVSILSFCIICVSLIFGFYGVSASAEEGVTPRAIPTDLTGYTVTVPAGWSATASYGNFDVNVSADGGKSFWSHFAIGYTGNLASTADKVFFYSTTSASGFILNPSYALNLMFEGGSDVSNTNLIQWLVDNNASFEGGSTPEPETSSISGGIYHFNTFGNLPDIPGASWSDGEGYTYSYTLAGKYVTTSRTISFTNFNITFDEYVSSSHYTVTFSVDTDDGVTDLATYSASYGQIELETRSDLKYLVFDEALIGTYNDIEFIRQFLVSGFPDTDTSSTDNPWAYILEMIIEALKVDLFGYFSVWDIFTTICGIFIVTWLLKLLAGG